MTGCGIESSAFHRCMFFDHMAQKIFIAPKLKDSLTFGASAIRSSGSQATHNLHTTFFHREEFRGRS